VGFDYFLPDDVTPAAGLTFGPTAAGATSPVQILHVWYNKGTPGGIVNNVSFQLLDPSTGASSGLNWQDEHWVEMRINGGSNPSNSSQFRAVTTDWVKVGSGTALLAPNIPGNCAYFLEMRLHPPMKDGVATETVPFRLATVYNDTAFALAPGMQFLGSGILTGVGDRALTEWIDAPTVLASGTPDALVHVARRWYLASGISLRTCATDDLTLNQTDGAAAALVSGKEYKAVISQAPGSGTADLAATVTKGVAAATGVSIAPAVPAGNLAIAVVTVHFHAGASVILQNDIVVVAVSGRGKPSIGTGLTVNIAAFRAFAADGLVVNRAASTVAVTASIDNWIWIGGSGAFTVTTTAAQPYAGALPLCKATAGASTVTAIVDLRTFFEPGAMLVRLKSMVAASGTTNFDATAMPSFWNIDRVYARLGAAVAGSGTTEFNPKTSAGASICPATFRPAIVAGQVAAEGYPNVTVGAADTFLGALSSDTTPAATMIEVDLVVYPIAKAA
jgi:hypothetical protein